MWRCVTRPAVAATIFLCLLTCCSEIPTLITEPGMGPPVRLVVNHLNCELASIIASKDPVILEREAADARLRKLLPKLQYYHFVASALLTIDTADAEGIFPSAAYLLPTSTINVGGQWSGTQERNVQVAYSIDLAQIGKGCNRQALIGPDSYLNGSLRLGDIVADGLIALDATKDVNAYSSGGPITPAFDATIDDSHPMELRLTCADYSAGSSGTPAKPTRDPGDCSFTKNDPPYERTLTLALHGNVNFAPASDPQSPGTISFSGKAEIDRQEYVVSLTGSTIGEVPANAGLRTAQIQAASILQFTLSGNMTRDGVSKDGHASTSIGFSPSITLIGTIDKFRPPDRRSGQIKGLQGVTGLLTPSTELPLVTGTKVVYNISGPAGGTVFNPKNLYDEPGDQLFTRRQSRLRLKSVCGFCERNRKIERIVRGKFDSVREPCHLCGNIWN